MMVPVPGVKPSAPYSTVYVEPVSREFQLRVAVMSSGSTSIAVGAPQVRHDMFRSKVPVWPS